MPVKMILDCDPGHDDAIAMMMAAKHPAVELLGITVVAGNQTLEKTLENALNICQHLGIDVPVYAGMPQPLVRRQVVADSIHGETGLDGPVFAPLTMRAQEKHAVRFIIDTLLASDGDIVLVPIGPATNIAAAMRTEPRILPKIKEIVIMGGCFGENPFGPGAEFNFLADPEAADVVFRAGVPVVMMGLDLTTKTTCTADVIARMEAIGNRAGNLFGDVMRFSKTIFEGLGLDGGLVHDATCVGYLIDPTMFDVREAYTEIDLNRGLGYGRTFCDFTGVTGKAVNSKIGIAMAGDRFWDLTEKCLRMYGE